MTAPPPQDLDTTHQLSSYEPTDYGKVLFYKLQPFYNRKRGKAYPASVGQ